MKKQLSPSYPVLPLRDIVVFPHMIVPLFVGRERSVRALEEVMREDKQILLSSQIDPTQDDPSADGIYKAGVLANVLQLLKLPDGTVKVLVEGKSRVRIVEFIENDAYFEAECEPLTEMPGDPASVEALLRSVAEEFERYAKIKKNVPEEALAAVAESREPAKLADLAASMCSAIRTSRPKPRSTIRLARAVRAAARPRTDAPENPATDRAATRRRSAPRIAAARPDR